MLTIQLEPELGQRLRKLAEQTGRTKDFHAREAILSYLEEQEDIALAVQRLQNITKTYSAEEVKRELGLQT